MHLEIQIMFNCYHKKNQFNTHKGSIKHYFREILMGLENIRMLKNQEVTSENTDSVIHTSEISL